MNRGRGVLLDTHIWVRLQSKSKTISREALIAVRKASSSQSVYVASISIWELAMLAAKKRLKFERPIRQWVEEALGKPGLELLPLSPEIAMEAAALPETMHKDPADRIIVASALVEHITLITSDQMILAFAEQIGVRTIEG